MSYFAILVMILVGIIVVLSAVICILSLIIFSKGKSKSVYDQMKEDEEQMDYLKKGK